MGWTAYRFLYTWSHIAEAYAAWDTGTLLVAYMKSHDNRWPTSWEELLSVLSDESGDQIPLRGAHAGDLAYGSSLREMVAVDWTFDPVHRDAKSPVTRLDKTAFPIVWEGHDPNEMVRAYLKEAVRQSSADQ
jgi:hypothetical protein